MINLQWQDQDPASSFIGWRMSMGIRELEDNFELGNPLKQYQSKQSKKYHYLLLIIIITIMAILFLILIWNLKI